MDSSHIVNSTIATQDMADAAITPEKLAPDARPLRTATRVVCAANAVDTTRCDYTADGTDDQVEIQAAIDSLPGDEESGGGTVILSEGDFTTSAPINFTKRAIIRGQGIRATTLHLADSANTDMFRAQHTARHSEISNMRLNGNKAHQSGVSNGIWLIDSRSGFLVYRVLIHNFLNNGILIGGATATRDQPTIKIVLNEFGENGNAGILIDDAGFTNQMIWIERNSTWMNVWDIDIVDSTGKNYAIYITQNWLQGTERENIRIR
ncbi:MAG: hypothetical protein V3U31_06965, partial [Dehalococcoidia bacterium]